MLQTPKIADGTEEWTAGPVRGTPFSKVAMKTIRRQVGPWDVASPRRWHGI